MNSKNIEQSLYRSLSQAPAPDFETLIQLPYRRMEEHDFITRQEIKQEARPVRGYAAALSLCFTLLLLVAGGWTYQYRLPSSRISLDVNPSIEIVTNRQNQVLEVNALNMDAQKVLEDQNYRLEELDTAVASIVTEVIDHGYLNADRNVILVSVENKNTEKAKEMASSLNQVIKKSAVAHAVEPKVLRQTLKKDKEASKEAKKLEVSVGKLKLLKKIETANKAITAESLAHKSMTELLSIAEENKVNLKDMLQMDENSSEISPKLTPAQGASDNEGSLEDSSGGKNKIKPNDSLQDQEKDLKEEQKEHGRDQENSKSDGKDRSNIKNKIKNKDRDKTPEKDKAVGKSKEKGKENNSKGKAKRNKGKSNHAREDRSGQERNDKNKESAENDRDGSGDNE